MSDNCIFRCDVCTDGCILIAPDDDSGNPETCPYNKDMNAKWRRVA